MGMRLSSGPASSRLKRWSQQATYTMTSFCFYDQNPSGIGFLVQIRAFVIYTSLGVQNFKCERQHEKDSGLDSEMWMPSSNWPIQYNIIQRFHMTSHLPYRGV